MTADETALKAHKALLNGSGELSYFEHRGIEAQTVKEAQVGYDAEREAFTYPCIAKGGGLLGIHYKSKGRDARGKRSQWWGGYATNLPAKADGKRPDAPAKVIPFGLETLEGVKPGSLVVLCCGEEDALSLRQAGYTALSQPGAGLLEPAYAKAFAGFEVVVFYDAGEEEDARKDARTLQAAGALSVRVVEWPKDAPNGADINGRLVDDPQGFEEWAQEMIAAARPLSEVSIEAAPKRAGEPDSYGGASLNGIPPRTMTATELLGMELPPIRWTVPDILPEGIILLAGRAKIGKSYLVLELCIAVATGGEALGRIPVGRGTALYIALDDNKRRLQKRLREMLPGRDALQNLHICLSFPRLNEGGVEALDAWLSEHPDTKLVVIDILQAIRPRASANRNIYEVDYESLASLKPIVEKHAGVSIVVVHHLNQTQSNDPLQLISGSEGLVGVVDGALIMRRERGKVDATFYITGKDIEEEREQALKWDANLKSWSLMGNAEEFMMSDQRRAIRRALQELGRPATSAEVAKHLDEPYENVRKLIPKMENEGIVCLARTQGTTKYYTTVPNDPNDPNTPRDGMVGSVGMSEAPVPAEAEGSSGTGEKADEHARDCLCDECLPL